MPFDILLDLGSSSSSSESIEMIISMRRLPVDVRNLSCLGPDFIWISAHPVPRLVAVVCWIQT